MEQNSLEYAGFWIRTWATVIDVVLILIITGPILVSIYGPSYFASAFSTDARMVSGPADFLLSYVLPTIATILFWIYKSATPGKMAIKSKIVDATTGQRPSNGQLIGRYFAYFISFAPMGLGVFWIAFDKRKQSWHDKLAGTVVVRKKNTGPEPVTFAS